MNKAEYSFVPVFKVQAKTSALSSCLSKDVVEIEETERRTRACKCGAAAA